MDISRSPKLAFGLTALVVSIFTAGVVWASALASPPQHVRNWEFIPSSAVGAVNLTPTNVTLTQSTFGSQPGSFPSQSIIVSNDGNSNASTSDIFFTATVDNSVNANNTSNGNGVVSRHMYSGDPPLSLDGRFNYFSVVRGTLGTNTNQNVRLTVIY